MTPQELKNSILQLAIQGKLVEQRPEEGTAAELLEKILATKNTKATKGGRSPISDDEKPFDIPESWEWVRLGDAFDIEMGQSPDGASVSEAAGGLEFHQGKLFFGEKYLKQSPQRTTAPTKIAEPNSVLLCVRAPVGKVNITNRRICIGRGLCSILPLAGMDVDFIYYLLAAFETTFVRHATGTTFVAITGKVVKMFPFPLPPLAEQKRIVAKIEELLPLIDRYEKAWSKLEDFNKRFPVDMQKSLLQMAIQGKLVDQRAEEGTAAELLEKILATKNTEDVKRKSRAKSAKSAKESRIASNVSRPVEDAPFEIPESWVWVRLEELLLSQPSNGVSPHGVDYPTPYKNLTLTATTSGYFRPEAFKYVEVSSELAEKYYLHDDDILIQRSNSRELVGTSCIYRHGDNKFIYPDLMMRLHLLDGVSVDFVDFVLKSPPCRAYFQATASGTSESMPKINQSIVRNTLIPLPPLAEQKRIVAKLEELLPLCERLK